MAGRYVGPIRRGRPCQYLERQGGPRPQRSVFAELPTSREHRGTVTNAHSSDRAQSGPMHPTAILAIICTSYFMVILDNSIIFTGLPRIESSMHFGVTGLTWVQDAYTLVFGG